MEKDTYRAEYVARSRRLWTLRLDGTRWAGGGCDRVWMMLRENLVDDVIVLVEAHGGGEMLLDH